MRPSAFVFIKFLQKGYNKIPEIHAGHYKEE